ncbi:phosphotransferase family protein [Nostocoides australiense]|nr:aminoglycoside phosphotransferase family protein [Tetrasphaera australiensis]
MKMPRRDLDLAAVLHQLDPGLGQAWIEELGEGWDNVAYAVRRPVGDDLLLRISKFADPEERARTLHTDVALLDFVAAHATLATNRVLAADPQTGALLLTPVPGRSADLLSPADPARAARELGVFLARLHTAEPPPGLVEPGRDLGLWRREAASAWGEARALCAEDVQREVDSFLAAPLPPRPERMVFCHNDLGDEHVIVDPASGQISGVIDWSDAVHDDPARDFALLLFDFGDAFFEGAWAAYGGTDEQLPVRARWYGARAGILGVCDRARRGDPGLTASLARLRSVLARPAT